MHFFGTFLMFIICELIVYPYMVNMHSRKVVRQSTSHQLVVEVAQRLKLNAKI
jgi:hypothetical protein